MFFILPPYLESLAGSITPSILLISHANSLLIPLSQGCLLKKQDNLSGGSTGWKNQKHLCLIFPPCAYIHLSLSPSFGDSYAETSRLLSDLSCGSMKVE